MISPSTFGMPPASPSNRLSRFLKFSSKYATLTGRKLENKFSILEALMLSFIFMMRLLSKKKELFRGGILSIKVISSRKAIVVLLAIFCPSILSRLLQVLVWEEISASGIAILISWRKSSMDIIKEFILLTGANGAQWINVCCLQGSIIQLLCGILM